MPRSPLQRTLLALLPIISAALAALAGARGWPMLLSLLAMAVAATAAAVIYWSGPLEERTIDVARLEQLTEAPLDIAAATTAGTSAPAAENSIATAPAFELATPLTAATDPATASLPAPGSTGTLADRLAGELVEEDLLTGLLAPESFFARFTAGLKRCGDAHQSAVLVICDLDRFGEINRTAGLIDANRLLRNIADSFRLTVREGDLLARLGGDEFALFFPGLPPEIAESRVRDLRAAVREAASLTLAEDPQRVTISIGTSCFPLDGETGEVLIEAADVALQQAKAIRALQADHPMPAPLALARH